MNKSVRFFAEAAVIAALYAALAILFAAISSGPIQVRPSESLTVLPALFGSAVPGLFVGCLIANLFTGNVIDTIFGSLITLAAAILTRGFGKTLARKADHAPRDSKKDLRVLLLPLPNVVLNALCLPFVFVFGYGIRSFGNASSTLGVLGLFALTVLAGEAIACYGLGLPLYFAVKKLRKP